jgi:pimeloyl-ACP methyl ester carboxylesterase
MPPPIQYAIQYAVTEDNVSIACCSLGVAGAGQPLIVLPSGPWAPMELEWQVPAWESWHQGLGRQRRLIRYDNRGTGLSTSLSNSTGGADGAALDLSQDLSRDLSLEAQVSDLVAVARRLIPHQPATLLAPQSSGPAAIAYAARYPRRVSRLILWCTYARRAD